MTQTRFSAGHPRSAADPRTQISYFATAPATARLRTETPPCGCTGGYALTKQNCDPGIYRRGGPPRSAQTCTGGVRVELGAARRSEAAARAAELGVLDAQDR